MNLIEFLSLRHREAMPPPSSEGGKKNFKPPIIKGRQCALVVGELLATPANNVGADAHIRPRYVVESLHHRSDGPPPFRQGRQPSPTLDFLPFCTIT